MAALGAPVLVPDKFIDGKVRAPANITHTPSTHISSYYYNLKSIVLHNLADCRQNANMNLLKIN